MVKFKVSKAEALSNSCFSNVCEFHRAWMLPLMKDCIKSTELQYFISHFLPMAAQLRQKGKLRECRNCAELFPLSNENPIFQKKKTILHSLEDAQIWKILFSN